MFKKLFKYKPTPQEQELIDIVNDMLKHPGTTVVMTPISIKYFLVNKDKHYYIKLSAETIQIVNTRFSITKSVNEKTYNQMVDAVCVFMEKDRMQLETQLFENENKILSEIREALKIK